MTKYTTDEIGRPGKPPKLRRFPWRLWLFALLMTGAAGAGGYFAWHFREEAKVGADCKTSYAALMTEKGAAQQEITNCKATLAKQTADMKTSLDSTAMNAKTLEQQNQQLSTNLNATKEELTTLREQRAETEKRMAAIEEIQKQFAKMIHTGTMKVTSRRGSLVLSLPAEVLFPSGVAELSKDGEIKVIEVGVTLKQFPDRRFLVIGHSDNQPLKNSVFKDNWELSTARALTVTRFLVQAGMNPKNLLPTGAGEHDPLLEKASAKELARNRRIEIALLPAINELPPLPASVTDGKTEPPAASTEKTADKK
ncbi:MAG: OmpA family protein [Deltaproteobacteria bacterium]|nr:OmpA family protein [Deltaproteobacteria bacterium]MDQ3297807.1 OmpA family protein [Myxococcota bacterium]